MSKNKPDHPGGSGKPIEPGRFAYDGLERVIHEKARLGIMSSLATHPDGLLFNDLKGLCSLTDGNLSRHLQLLQESGFVEVWKGFKNNRPQTLVRLTPDGKKRFLEYVAVLENVVQDALKAEKSPTPRSAPKGLSPA
jgi:DNA-binding MarR family transcriptional regulator